MTNFTFTAEQAAAIVARWNDLADNAHQIEASQLHTILGDNFDDEMEDTGSAQIEIRGLHSKSGNPETFYVDESEVTAE